MKRIFHIFVLLLMMAGASQAATVTLAWDPNPEPDIAGYRIYWRTNGGNYATNRMLAVTNGTTGSVSNLLLGTTYRFVATAYNTSGLESDYSNEVMASIPGKPTPPTNLRTNQVIVKTVLMQSPSADGAWVAVHTFDDVVLTNTMDKAFYRSGLALQINHPFELPQPERVPQVIDAVPPLPPTTK